MEPTLTVYGIGADGWEGLNSHAQQGILAAEVLLGGVRHLDLVPPVEGQQRLSWPSPLREKLPELLASVTGKEVVVLASGDPLVSGIGSTLIDLLGADRVRVVPAVSSVALARARMGWSAESVEVISLVGRDPYGVLRSLAPGHRLLVLSSDAHTPATVCALLRDAGYGASAVTVLGDLGAATESRTEALAADWLGAAPDLNVLAIRCSASGGKRSPGWSSGLPDDCFESDGQLTRRDVRASALARLAPRPGELLWDIGAGAGSIGIEWLRTHPQVAAVAIEADPERAARIERNARTLGVPRLRVVLGTAPEALAGLPAPDAVFIGGGATRDGVLDAALAALKPGGRLVVHGVTHQTEALLFEQYADRGGELTRIQVEVAAPIGTFTGWSPTRAVTQWAYTSDPIGT